MNIENDKVKILVIDDSDVIRNSLKKFLSDYNIDVFTCNDGLEGLQKAVEYKPQLIILDLMMPNLDGIKMLRVLKILENVKQIPVIVISGHTNKDNVVAAMEAGAEKIVSKPLSKESMIKAIDDVLGKTFLVSTKKIMSFSATEKEQFLREVKRFFISSLVTKKESIRQSLNHRNKELLKLVIHELKGSGGTAGFTNITDQCVELETVIDDPAKTWGDINSKCEALLQSLSQIESLHVTRTTLCS